jgi:hypothetical protein
MEIYIYDNASGENSYGSCSVGRGLKSNMPALAALHQVIEAFMGKTNYCCQSLMSSVRKSLTFHLILIALLPPEEIRMKVNKGRSATQLKVLIQRSISRTRMMMMMLCRLSKI